MCATITLKMCERRESYEKKSVFEQHQINQHFSKKLDCFIVTSNTFLAFHKYIIVCCVH